MTSREGWRDGSFHLTLKSDPPRECMGVKASLLVEPGREPHRVNRKEFPRRPWAMGRGRQDCWPSGHGPGMGVRRMAAAGALGEALRLPSCPSSHPPGRVSRLWPPDSDSY